MTIASTSLSGLRADSTAMDAAASNVANLETPGFRRRQVEASERPDGGVQVHVSTRAEPDADAGPESDLVDEREAGHDFAANLAVFRRADEALGTLLDATA